MPEVDDERAEVINYGLQNIIGEIPKIFLLLIIAFLLQMLKEVLSLCNGRLKKFSDYNFFESIYVINL